MSILFDIGSGGAYRGGMLKSVSHVVHGIERFLSLMPEPLVLKAMSSQDRHQR